MSSSALADSLPGLLLVALCAAACASNHRGVEPSVPERSMPREQVRTSWAAKDASTGSADAGVDAGFSQPSSRDAAAAVAPPPSAVEPSLDALRENYREWTKRTPEPISISNSIWALCRLPSVAEQAFVESEHGDGLYLLDWVNAQAARGLAARGRPAFPVGAAIVKEKLKLRADGTSMVVALGLMIKRGPGFDSTHADWDFGYWEPSSGLASGAESARHCGGCHAGSKTDYVFVDMSWRLPPSK